MSRATSALLSHYLSLQNVTFLMFLSLVTVSRFYITKGNTEEIRANYLSRKFVLGQFLKISMR